MRHFGTVLAALVIAPLAWLLLAFGEARSLQAFGGQAGSTPDPAATLDSRDFLQPLLFLAAAGILLGLIATLRFSPLGAFLTGLAYAGSYALLLAGPEQTLKLFPTNVSLFGLHADATTPIRTGTAALVGAALLIAVVSVGRWRRWPDTWGSDYTPTASYGSSGYSSPGYGSSSGYPSSGYGWGSEVVAEREPVNLMRWTSSLRGR
jgi:hypothetical protein